MTTEEMKLVGAAPKLLEALHNLLTLTSIKYGNTDTVANCAMLEACDVIEAATGKRPGISSALSA